MGTWAHLLYPRVLVPITRKMKYFQAEDHPMRFPDHHQHHHCYHLHYHCRHHRSLHTAYCTLPRMHHWPSYPIFDLCGAQDKPYEGSIGTSSAFEVDKVVWWRGVTTTTNCQLEAFSPLFSRF